ncbi:MAG: LolA-like putative outer membrane lipoprotein chaperone [Bacteroidales bacterium]|nr:LolA-like putative outer membrane lipoprotein chaperone [Bacteroidales bacterium]
MNQKLKIFLLLLLGVSFNLTAQEDAKQLLDKMSATFSRNKGYTISFTMNIKQIRQKTSESFNARIDLKGNQFYLTTPDIEAWFNGKTQWVLMRQNNEVNMTTPTEQELRQTNPIQVINSYKKGYSYEYKGTRNDIKGRSSYVIELTPEKKGDIEYITLLINKENYAPNSILIRQKGSVESSIYIDSIKRDVNFPESLFVFDKKKHPDAEIIDLR